MIEVDNNSHTLNNQQIQSSCFIIREVYENGSSCEYFESQLDFALESQVKIIVIEPTKLGRETTYWLKLGHGLRLTSTISGLGCLGIIFFLPEKSSLYLPLGFCSFIAASVHIVSWETDACSRYRIETNMSKLQRLPLCNLMSSDPVVLVKRNNKLPRILYAIIASTSFSWCSWFIYKRINF